MSVAASPVPAPAVAATAPLPAPTPADREPAARPFAELLRQSRAVEPPRSESAAKATTTPDRAAAAPGDDTRLETETPPATETPPDTIDGTPRSDATRARARSGAGTARPAPRAAAVAERAEPGRERSATARPRDDGSGSSDASTATLPLAPFAPPAVPAGAAAHGIRADAAPHRAPPAGAGQDTGAGGAAPVTLPPSTASAAAHDGTVRRDAADAALRADPRDAARTGDGETAAASAASFAQLLGDAQVADRARPAAASTEPPTPVPNLAGPTATSPGLVAHDAAAASPATATLAVPTDAPEFAAAFGVQVSVFARDGVQHAELHLNPAETGPVSITITLDGSQAHVAFGADLAATREAIENGLPMLASALRDAGFTLAGGGVAQHSGAGGGRGGDMPSGRARQAREATADGDAVGAAAVRHSMRRVAAGGIDLYA